MTDAKGDDTGELLIVTGMSGAGRSTAANVLEDLDWYVVDNLPPQMLKPLVDLTSLAGEALPKVAVVVDVRGRELFLGLPEVTRALRDAHAAVLPGYHLNKRHWNTVIIDGSLPDGAVRDMIEDSYDLVVSKLPRTHRRALGWRGDSG